MLIYIILQILSSFCIAFAQTIAKYSLRHINLIRFLMFRSLAGAIFSIPLFFTMEFHSSSIQSGLFLALSVLLTPIGINIFYFAGLKQGNIAVQNALMRTASFFVLIMNLVLFGQSVTYQNTIGMLMIAAGSCLILFGDSHVKPLGTLFGIATAIITAASLIVQKELLLIMQKSTLIFFQNMINYIFMGMLYLVQSTNGSSESDQCSPADKAKSIGIAFASGFLVYFIADYLKYSAMTHTGTFVTSCMQALQLPFTIILARIMLKEKINTTIVRAVVCILCGAILAAI